MKRTADAEQAAAVRFCDADRENSPLKAVIARRYPCSSSLQTSHAYPYVIANQLRILLRHCEPVLKLVWQS